MTAFVKCDFFIFSNTVRYGQTVAGNGHKAEINISNIYDKSCTFFFFFFFFFFFAVQFRFTPTSSLELCCIAFSGSGEHVSVNIAFIISFFKIHLHIMMFIKVKLLMSLIKPPNEANICASVLRIYYSVQSNYFSHVCQKVVS